MNDPRRRGRRAVALGAALTVACTLAVAGPAVGDEHTTTTSAIDPTEFAEPGVDFRPGVRWWWPGNAASQEDLLAQVDYLHENGFGAVEIVAFSKGFLTPQALEGNPGLGGSIYDAVPGYDTEAILGYESPEYFAKLDAVIARANELGITVDLNIGSGYLASDDSIDLEDSQNTMALGRATVRVDAAGALTLVSGDVSVPTGAGKLSLGIPEAEVSPFFASEKFGFDFGEWDPANVHLNSVMLAPITGQGADLTTANQTLTSDFSSVKTYEQQSVLDLDTAQLSYPSDGQTTFGVDTSTLAAGDYEIVALYSATTGAYGFNSIIENTTTDKRNYIVDHLNPVAITKLVNGWLGEAALNDIVESRDIRAAFNDSYEFYTDRHYNDLIQAAAESQELLGYDITPYLPSLYSIYQDSFLIDGTPTVKPEYAALGLQTPEVSRFGGGSGVPLLASNLSEEESQRIVHDYGVLLNDSFLQGLEAFSSTLGEYGIDYRQQAYNPPIDTLKSSQYVDIPETEGLDEYQLKRVASGAHLYGKNLVTSEVFTLGSVPFQITPEFMKQGYDLMATSGVNNFFYHGLSATYSGNDDPAFTSDDNLFAEEGWRAWPTIGVEMADTAGIADYYASMNDYASRANYVMQSGTNSSDVAIYMPLFGALASGGGFGGGSTPLASVTTAQANGWAWDAINDDTIQTGLSWDGSHLVANGGNASFDAMLVESGTVPLETMQALQKLKDAGAPIVFVDSAPAAQPGYAGGEYAALDAQVSEIAAAMGGAVEAAAVPAALAASVDAPISYEENADIRFGRRTLPTGGELAYVRNTSAEAATGVNLTVADGLDSCWWLDPETGEIFDAEVDGNVVSATLDASGAVVLLCEPAGTGIADSAVSDGTPSSIDTTERSVGHQLGAFSLEVTADNLGTNAPGEPSTSEYTGEVLGDWSADGVLGNELRYVTDSGTYRTTVEIPDAADLLEGGAVLNLGTVNNAATVRVNPGTEHELVTQLYAAPYEVDIAPALVNGSNVIEIDVQPVQSNRREGLKELYNSDPVANVKYQAYNSVHGGSGLIPAGLVGPVTLNSAVESIAEPSPTGTTDPTPQPTSTDGTGTTVPTTSPGNGGGNGSGNGSGNGGSDAGGQDGDLATTGVDGSLAGFLALLGVVLAGTGVAFLIKKRRGRVTSE
ncbi:glycosyl hydrolase [Pseudoclavibacter sp. VKM Ac-2888]|uniref:glycosyl hydrolase n=1 Tax=Pseudoclavibacter sp. VKM Ac-2888 TaxID=2783830 RepID=UPI00188B2F67|nr:glycosyl hydrolase [Pseudoclavibacter sp. VKM Ac-2888]MBF4550809.1 hypothetical protein [Pseudoclavibacter sp. VKM Ac-2888]